MIVEQAIFGEVKGGHALRAASGDAAAAAELAPRLDLPDTAPPGADWSPFVSGFPHRDHFVFARTFQDSRAARAGMVLSHALVVPIESIIFASDLRPLFDQFVVEANAPSEIRTLDLNLGQEVPLAAVDLPAAAAALSVRMPGPVVRLGHEGFEELVVSLWGSFWPALRRTFAFRLSFSPTDLVETPQPALVCTPPSMAARWRGYRLLDASDPRKDSLTAAMLSGRSEGAPLRSFADQIGAEIVSFGDLPLLEQAYRFAVLMPDTVANTIAAVRLVERLSPDRAGGAISKADLLSRLVRHLKSATADDTLPLRNLVLRGFDQDERLWTELSNWAADNSFPMAQDVPFKSVIAAATEASESAEDWRKAILLGLSRAARAQGTAFASAFWRWAEADPAIVGPLWNLTQADKGLEDRLVDVAPQRLTPGAAQQILDRAREERLYRLHAATASAVYIPCDAVRLQFTVEPPLGTDGLRLALRNATPDEVVACAIDIAEPRVVQLAAEHVAEAPSLLANVDMSGGAARAVWSTALGHNLDAWRGPADPRAAFDAILVDLLEGLPVAPKLVYRLSRTPLADLTGFSRRTELWSMPIGQTRGVLLGATARGWIDRAGTGAPPFEVDLELQTAILADPKLGELLDQFAHGGIAAAIQIMAALPAFEEHRFRSWLRAATQRTSPISAGDAEAIGRLAHARHWRYVVDDLMQMMRGGREDARPALRVCVSMIRVLERWWHGLSPVSPTEKWQSFEDLATELYPIGPNQNDLWERAGGHDGDLDWTGNGRTRWRHALGQIRHGGKGPRPHKLLREMQDDFPSNTSLRFLAEDDEFKEIR